MLTWEELPPCPVATTVRLIGNKWKPLIIRDLMEGTKRFGEFRKSIPGISQKALTENLRALEEDGLILRETGESLKPILDAMTAWGTAYKKRLSQES